MGVYARNYSEQIKGVKQALTTYESYDTTALTNNKLVHGVPRDSFYYDRFARRCPVYEVRA